MNRKEILISALRHQDSAYVPYAINMTVEGCDKYGEQLLKDYPNEQVMEDYRRGMLDKMQAVQLAIGNHILYINAPWWDWYNLTDEFLKEEDTPGRLPDTIGRGSYEQFFEKTRYLRETYDAYLLVTIWGSHWEKAYFSRGIENFLADLAGDPEWSQQLLDMIIRKNLVMLENILCCNDYEGVLLGSDWGTQRDLIMSPKCWKTMIQPGEQQEYDLIKRYGKDVFIHSCGNIVKIMEELTQMGVDALNPVQPECMDLSELKRLYGDKIAFYGGISTQRTLPNGTPEQVARETEQTIKLMSVHGGYITAPSQEIQVDVPYENLRALIDTARAHSIR